ncbi:hypothetical protein [Moritella marina]|uniref:hypothetical protein n=1 Tax=Moritella marina TaxID=90736 RepID=UPI003703A0E8
MHGPYIYKLSQAHNLDLLTSTSIKALSSQTVIVELRNDYTRAKNNVAELSKRYGPRHDKMIHANAQFNEAEQNAQKALQQLALGFKNNLTLLQQNESAIVAALQGKKLNTVLSLNKKPVTTNLTVS